MRKEIINSNDLLSKILHLIHHDEVFIIYEFLLCLSYITSEKVDLKSTISNAFLEKLVSFLDSDNENIQMVLMIIIINLNTLCVISKNKIKELKLLEQLIELFINKNKKSKKFKIKCLFLILSLLKTQPFAIEYDKITIVTQRLIRMFNKLIIVNENKFFNDALKFLSLISEEFKKSTDIICSFCDLKKLLSFLENKKTKTIIDCITIIGNICKGTEVNTQKVIDAGLLPYLKKLVFHSKRLIKRDTCWIISNIAAGSLEQTDSVIRNDFIPLLEFVIKNDNYKVYLI
jgi:importin subunit alpha-1